MKTKLRCTVTFEYEADSKYYGGSTDPNEMAQVDQLSFEEPDNLFGMLDGSDYTVRVEPVEEDI